MEQKEDRGRFSSKRKMEAVLRLLKGETLDAVSRDHGVTAAKLSEWRDEFLRGAEAGANRHAEEIERLKQIGVQQPDVQTTAEQPGFAIRGRHQTLARQERAL